MQNSVVAIQTSFISFSTKLALLLHFGIFLFTIIFFQFYSLTNFYFDIMYLAICEHRSLICQLARNQFGEYLEVADKADTVS